jgi:hypothetical protein
MSNPPSFEELVCLHFGWTITVSASPNFAGPQLKTTWKYNKDQQGDSTDARFSGQAVPKSISSVSKSCPSGPWSQLAYRMKEHEGTTENHLPLWCPSERWQPLPKLFGTGYSDCAAWKDPPHWIIIDEWANGREDSLRDRRERTTRPGVETRKRKPGNPTHSKTKYQMVEANSNTCHCNLHRGEHCHDTAA